MISLDDGVTTVTLPHHMSWIDEYTWSPVAQSHEYTLTGSLVVQNGTKLKGRNITLQASQDMAWITRSDLDQLKTWADTAGQELTLNIRSTTKTVIFRHEDQAIEAEVVGYHRDPAPDAFYVTTLKLMEV